MPIQWNKFPDTWNDIYIPNVKFLIDRHVVFLMSCSDPNTIMEQLFLIMILPAQNILSLTIDISYFAPGTHERVTKPGVLATAECLSRILTKSVLNTRTGPVTVQIADLHTLQNQFYFQDGFANLISAMPILVKIVQEEKLTVVFPDDGAAKRYSELLFQLIPNCPVIVCSKVRNGEKRVITISELKNFPQDEQERKALFKKLIIVDDLCHSGATLAVCGEELQKLNGVEEVHAWITHGVFENQNYLKFLQGGQYEHCFNTVRMTDSIPERASQIESHRLNQDKKIQIYKMSHHIGIELLRNRFGISYWTKLNHLSKRFQPTYDTFVNPFVVCCSKNVDKKLALEKVIDSELFYWNQHHTIIVDAQSGVANQPHSIQEGEQGCFNRLMEGRKTLQNKYKHNSQCHVLVFAVENAVIEIADGRWEDRACVMIQWRISPDSWLPVQTGWSRGVAVPDYIMKKVIASNFTKTAGEFMEEEDFRINASNWFKKFGFDRATLIAETFKSILIPSP